MGHLDERGPQHPQPDLAHPQAVVDVVVGDRQLLVEAAHAIEDLAAGDEASAGHGRDLADDVAGGAVPQFVVRRAVADEPRQRMVDADAQVLEPPAPTASKRPRDDSKDAPGAHARKDVAQRCTAHVGGAAADMTGQRTNGCVR